jgi:acyl-phosphate glycerol 3-phosphate acyltransferase
MPALALFGVVALGSYLLGAVPFGYLMARWRGVDILRHGSGNIGATNVGRVLGRRFGILVFVLDFAKGALPVGLAAWLARSVALDLPKQSLEVTAGLAAFLGHLFPVYLNFRGGKGVATGAGVVAVLVPGPALAALLAWITVLCISRYVSLSSLCAVVVLCVLRLVMTPEPFAPDTRTLTLLCFVAAGLVFVRHRANIARLLHGNENRLKETPAMLMLTKTLHVLALGLWFGSVVFFTFAAVLIFQSFDSLAAKPPAERPAWLPQSFSKENATQLASYAVGPIFPWYFLLQGSCGILALATCLPWPSWEPQQTVHKIRFVIVALAFATVIAAWPIAQKVGDLRDARYSSDPTAAASAKADFGRWHGYSLVLNFVSLGLVTVGMALVARLPNTIPSSAEAGNMPSRPETKMPIHSS